MTAIYRSATTCRKKLISGIALTFGLSFLSGCATSKNDMWDLDGSPTMQELWQQGGTGGVGDDLTQRGLLDTRSELRRGIDDGALIDQRVNYTRSAANEIYSQFSRLPNPDLVMYVFPHLAGADPVPIPGYSTVFTLYSRPQYAMPGETARPQVPAQQHGHVSVELVGRQ
ncbi:TIGR03751 family conjugal transfer lipoprotein [Vreelandella nigrificans]|uniref:TIGR03751 family conjugal transfer lipoprotein n=1 Tax=Vreelandella nigrificans TaxID=2042704 RepID=A0A2A4HJ17_9GAMM|nr:TIGR03751 family conjugal transfer lipoprotein [Halomonas nigrificans]PCF94083.1 TIGR03751 family conjugal transfer lipoprotein [Halomonas nigrificans]